MNTQNYLDIQIRHGCESDLKQLAEIYNYYVVNSTVTLSWHQRSDAQFKNWYSMFSHDGPYFLLVAAIDDEIIAYTASHPFDLKDGYQSSVKTTIYCKAGTTQKGVGSQLYQKLFKLLIDSKIHRAYASISLPNPASLSFHKRFGFKQVAAFNEVARKFDRYIDVVWYEKKL